MQCTKLMRQTNKRKNQINNAVEVPRKCDNMHWLRIPLQMYSGVHAQTQLHMALDIALQKLQSNNCTAETALQQRHCMLYCLMHKMLHYKSVVETHKSIYSNTWRSAPLSIGRASTIFNPSLTRLVGEICLTQIGHLLFD